MLNGAVNRRTILIALITIIYYIVFIYTIWKYGYKWIVPLWSLPIVLIFVLLLSANRTSNFENETKILTYTLISYIIASLAIGAALIAIKFTKSRFYIVAIGFIVWFLLSAMFWYFKMRKSTC